MSIVHNILLLKRIVLFFAFIIEVRELPTIVNINSHNYQLRKLKKK
jgi:hypothetical protein